MAGDNQTFSESWYRIADQRICLRPGIHVRRQFYRGERWYVLENPINNQYFRLRPAAYSFVARLRPNRTVNQVWEEYLEVAPEEAPGQDAVIQLLSQLYFAGLLHYDNAEDSAELFQRYKKRRRKEISARFMNLMFIRFPLIDPDRFLNRMMPIVGPLIGWFGFMIWLVVVGAAGKVVLDNFSALKDESQAILAPGNLVWLYVGLVIIKTLHEFGHAFFCKKFGGEVHVMGVMLMIFTPIPYMDATSSWGFSSRWKRALVGLAGMIVEVFVAALAVFIWAKSSSGLAHNLAYNMMFIASVSTVLFNLNPLLRFDGYYILSDLLDFPNLHQQSAAHLKHVVKRYAFGVKKSVSPTASKREKTWLTTFGILSHIYRIFVFSAILLFVADRFLILGVLMAVICLVSWILVPLGKLIYYLLADPELDRCRAKAITAAVCFVGVLLLFLQWIPFPSHFRASGVIEAEEWSDVVNQTEGYLVEIVSAGGSMVEPGDVLIRLQNDELNLEVRRTQAQLREIQAQLRLAMNQQKANSKPLEYRLASVQDNLNLLNKRLAELEIRASIAGRWVAPQLDQLNGRWLVRGTSIGMIIGNEGFQFISPVMQNDVDRLFAKKIRNAEIRLYGEAEKVIGVESMKMIPVEKQSLPSAALGWMGGGDIPVEGADPKGTKTTEPFFEVRSVMAGGTEAKLVHGRSGKIRFKLPPEPLLPRAIRRLRQLLQRRYQI